MWFRSRENNISHIKDVKDEDKKAEERAREKSILYSEHYV